MQGSVRRSLALARCLGKALVILYGLLAGWHTYTRWITHGLARCVIHCVATKTMNLLESKLLTMGMEDIRTYRVRC